VTPTPRGVDGGVKINHLHIQIQYYELCVIGESKKRVDGVTTCCACCNQNYHWIDKQICRHHATDVGN
jgi:hypothetical protein